MNYRILGLLVVVTVIIACIIAVFFPEERLPWLIGYGWGMMTAIIIESAIKRG